jgi:hypothetical protein
MITKCLVTLNNDAVTVVKYGDDYIQFPAIGKDETYVFVKETDGRFEIVDEPREVEETPIENKEIKETTKKKSKKKSAK